MTPVQTLTTARGEFSVSSPNKVAQLPQPLETQVLFAQFLLCDLQIKVSTAFWASNQSPLTYSTS